MKAKYVVTGVIIIVGIGGLLEAYETWSVAPRLKAIYQEGLNAGVEEGKGMPFELCMNKWVSPALPPPSPLREVSHLKVFLEIETPQQIYYLLRDEKGNLLFARAPNLLPENLKREEIKIRGTKITLPIK